MGPRDDAAKKVQSVLCLETIPKFWTEDVSVVCRDGEWVQMNMRGMAGCFEHLSLAPGWTPRQHFRNTQKHTFLRLKS